MLTAGPERQNAGAILVVEDDASLRRLTQVQLEKLGYETRVAVDVGEALTVLRQYAVDLVICDLHLPAASGLELLKRVRAEYTGTKFVIVTAYGSINTAIEAMKLGAYDYLTKPVHPVELRALVERVFEQQRLAKEVHISQDAADPKSSFERLIGKSPSLTKVIELASRAARTDAAVLIRGETGTGKELLAKAIHFDSPRRDRPFIVVNCGSIPRDLVESELFGHVKGAFTGAVTNKQGRAEMANGGTLFLDEIGEMPHEMQVRLLRLLQEGEIQKVGATTANLVDVRIIAATHRDLEELIQSGTFREDLYYRLTVIPIELPPLRKRDEDIPELVEHFFRESKQKYKRNELRLPADVIDYFCRYDWPGNVRQLVNCIVRLVVLAPGPEITVSDLPEFLRNLVPRSPNGPYIVGSRPEQRTLDDVERRAILEAMELAKWNQTHAARELGITRKALRGRLQRYGILRPAS
jgi:DNA-binding NtrC family response regulator